MTIKQTLINRQCEYRVKPRNLGSTYGAWTNLGTPVLSYDDYYRNDSISTPGFRSLKRRQLPEHAHTRIRYTYLGDPTQVSKTWRWADGTWARNEYRGPPGVVGCSADMPAKYYPSLGPINNQAVARLFDALSQTKGSLLVSMAEIDKTAAMVAKTATRLAAAYTALRHGKVDEFSRVLGISMSKRRAGDLRARYKSQTYTEWQTARFASSTWLEFTYGWKPLISDVYAQAENLASYLTERQNVIREVKSSAKEVLVTVEDTSPTSLDWKISKATQMSSRVSYTVRYALSNGGASFVNVFGLNNPAIVAWEVIPFSFVVDWFLPIGNFLSQLSATSGLAFHSGTKTVKHVGASSSVIGARKAYNDQGGVCTPGLDYGGKAQQIQIENKSRVVLTSFPSVRLPEFKNPLSVSHATSALALLRTAFFR